MELTNMSTWRIAEAKTQLSTVLKQAADKPQIICRRDRPEAAVIGIALYERMRDAEREQDRPTVAQLVEELREIQREESAEIEVPERVDRPNPLEEAL